MWIGIYLFALVVGGVLLGASVLFGGSDSDGDGHADAGGGAGDELDSHAHAEVGLGQHGDPHHHGVDAAGAGHGLELFLWSFASLRFWTFFLAFFGLTGLVLDGLGLVPPGALGPALAAAMGLGVGWSALAVLRRLSTDSASSHARATDFVGKTARVLVPVGPEAVGKVRVRVGGSDVDLLALTDDPTGFRPRDEALVIQVEGTRVRIARLDDVTKD